MRKILFLAVFLSACTDTASGTGASCPTASPPTYDSFGKMFFDTYCTSCHSSARTGVQRGGAPVGRDYDTLAGIRAGLTVIDSRAASGPNETNETMPLGLPFPTLAERTTLGQFLACEKGK
jgi:cytochrome c5